MKDIIIYSMPRTGITALAKSFHTLKYIDFSEIFAQGFDFEIYDIKKQGIINYSVYNKVSNDTFSLKHQKLKKYYDIFYEPEYKIFKIFTSWHDVYKDEIDYLKFTKNKRKILLFRLDFFQQIISNEITDKKIDIATCLKIDFSKYSYILKQLKNSILDINFDEVILSEYLFYDPFYKNKFYEVFHVNYPNEQEFPLSSKIQLIKNYNSLNIEYKYSYLFQEYKEIRNILKKKIIDNNIKLIGDIRALN